MRQFGKAARDLTKPASANLPRMLVFPDPRATILIAGRIERFLCPLARGHLRAMAANCRSPGYCEGITRPFGVWKLVSQSGPVGRAPLVVLLLVASNVRNHQTTLSRSHYRVRFSTGTSAWELA